MQSTNSDSTLHLRPSLPDSADRNKAYTSELAALLQQQHTETYPELISKRKIIPLLQILRPLQRILLRSCPAKAVQISMQEVTAGWEGSLGKLAPGKVCLTDAQPVPHPACETQMGSQTPSKALLPRCVPVVGSPLCTVVFFLPRSFIPCFIRKNTHHFLYTPTL